MEQKEFEAAERRFMQAGDVIYKEGCKISDQHLQALDSFMADDGPPMLVVATAIFVVLACAFGLGLLAGALLL
jgi:hypothetical protein